MTIGYDVIGAYAIGGPGGEQITPPQPGPIDASLVPAERRVLFEGSLRTVAFEGSNRVVSFEGNIRKVIF